MLLWFIYVINSCVTSTLIPNIRSVNYSIVTPRSSSIIKTVLLHHKFPLQIQIKWNTV